MRHLQVEPKVEKMASDSQFLQLLSLTLTCFLVLEFALPPQPQLEKETKKRQSSLLHVSEKEMQYLHSSSCFNNSTIKILNVTQTKKKESTAQKKKASSEHC